MKLCIAGTYLITHHPTAQLFLLLLVKGDDDGKTEGVHSALPLRVRSATIAGTQRQSSFASAGNIHSHIHQKHNFVSINEQSTNHFYFSLRNMDCIRK